MFDWAKAHPWMTFWLTLFVILGATAVLDDMLTKPSACPTVMSVQASPDGIDIKGAP